MKPLSSALQSHLMGELTNLAYLVKITRTDGAIKGFTTHDQNLTIAGVTYVADGALTPSAIESRAGLAVDNLEVTGMLESAEIADVDLEAGLYDYARVDVYACNWADVTQGLVQLRRGWLGQVTRADVYYVAELRGLHDLLQRPVGDYYTPECRFDLGDARCTVNIAALTVTGTVTSVTDNANFMDTSQTAATGVYSYGKLTWATGANAGQSMEVKNWDNPSQTFTLWLPMPYAIETGDTYSVYPGCDKRFITCKNSFSNGANFGGFPYVPGVGNILKYPT
ncbi:MAG: DUF2163 domain-containing protein [Alphaproteobacteria bacterium]|nr:DUF2163 domain-containing protein [Alphaproteobacteria bacterium]